MGILEHRAQDTAWQNGPWAASCGAGKLGSPLAAAPSGMDRALVGPGGDHCKVAGAHQGTAVQRHPGTLGTVAAGQSSCSSR